MTETKGQNWQNVQEAVLPVVGSVARATNEVIMAKVDQHLNAPLRLYATFPTPNAVLNIGAGKIESGDGAAKVSPPSEDTLQEYLGAGINLTSAAITGSGAVTLNGGTFALPTTTINRYRRLFLVYKSTSNSVDVSFDSSPNGYVDLSVLRSSEDPGVKFSAMDGIPLGYIDLQCFNGSDQLKTADSATNIIENKVGSDHVLFRIGSGAGTGSGGDSSFKLQSISFNNATIKKGSIMLDSQVELYAAANFVVDLDAILAGANNTQYYLYIDLWTLPTVSSVGNSDRKVFSVDDSNFVILTTIPSATNPRRYLPIASLKTDGSGDYTLFDNLAARRHDTVAAFISEPQTVSYQVTTAVASDITAHGLAGEPQVVNLSYFDGTKKNGLDVASHLLNKGATNIEVATLGLTFGGGQYVQVEAIYFPNQAGNVVGLQHDFQSGWYQNTSTTTVAHGLQPGSIKGYEVQEWDVTNSKIRNIDRSALVVNFDNTNFYLNWSGLTPSATLQYRVVAGGTPIPSSIPVEFGGFNKFVGFGPGSYATLATAVAGAAPGDSILVNQSHTLTADLDINVADLRIAFMPGVVVTMAGALTNGLRLTAARIKLERLHLRVQPTGAQARGISIEAADCDLDRTIVELNTAQTLTDAVHITVAGARAYVRSRLLATLGTITNGLTNNDGASSAEVWG